MKGVVKNFDRSSLEKKPPEGDSEQVEELLDVTGWGNFGSRYKMAAGPTSITICNRLMRKIGKEISGEVRKNHYASTTPFYLSGDCLEPANQGIYWWPERESTYQILWGSLSKLF